jgi:peroxiredoxin
MVNHVTRKLQLGETVEDVPFVNADGMPVRLSDYPGPIVLVFIRHWHCITCRAHLDELLKYRETLVATGARIVVVAQKHPIVQHPSMRDLVILSDPDRSAYRYFSLERMPWTTLLRLGVIARYIGLIFRGWMPTTTDKDEDVMQLGGDFVISVDRRLLYAHRSSEPTDRPNIDEMIKALKV